LRIESDVSIQFYVARRGVRILSDKRQGKAAVDLPVTKAIAKSGEQIRIKRRVRVGSLRHRRTLLQGLRVSPILVSKLGKGQAHET
jgi:hypothetical protein